MASFTDTGNGDIGMPDRLQTHPKYYKQNYRKNLYTLTLSATTSGVAAGNIIGATAAASTNFGLINPSTSGKNLILTKLFIGIISGTPGAGPVFHGFCTTPPTVASPGGTIRSNFLGDTSQTSIVTPWALAAGSTATGGSAPITFRVADFSSTATAQASVGLVKTSEFLDGDIIVPPGVMWLPLWSAAGTSLLNAYSITWYEQGI